MSLSAGRIPDHDYAEICSDSTGRTNGSTGRSCKNEKPLKGGVLRRELAGM